MRSQCDLRDHDERVTALTPVCPRCEYDLRGTVATWTAECPIAGTCAECGLHFWWDEIFDPGRTAPRWCIEFTEREGIEAGGLVRAAIATALRSLLVWNFWRRLRMAHPIHPPRLLLYAAILFVPLVLIYALWQASLALHVRGLIERDIAMYRQMVQQDLARLQDSLARAGNPSAEWTARLENDAELRARQNEQLRQLQDRVAHLRATLGTPAVIDIPPALAAVEAVLFPFAEHSWGVIRDVPRRNIARGHPYPAPSQLYAAAASDSGIVIGTTGGLLPRSGEAVGVMNFVRWSILWQSFSWGLFLLLPAMMLLLPMSRSRAKVRWGHIGRVFAYSMIVPVAFVVSAGVMGSISMFLEGSPGEDLRAMALEIEHFGPWILLTAWWGCAIGLYLRIPRAWLIAPLLAIVALLIMLGVIGLFDRDFLIMISDDLV